MQINKILKEIHDGGGETEYGGLETICRFIEYLDEPKDLWMVFEVVENGRPILNSLSEIIGGFVGGQRVYEIV